MTEELSLESELLNFVKIKDDDTPGNIFLRKAALIQYSVSNSRFSSKTKEGLSDLGSAYLTLDEIVLGFFDEALKLIGDKKSFTVEMIDGILWLYGNVVHTMKMKINVGSAEDPEIRSAFMTLSFVLHAIYFRINEGRGYNDDLVTKMKSYDFPHDVADGVKKIEMEFYNDLIELTRFTEFKELLGDDYIMFREKLKIIRTYYDTPNVFFLELKKLSDEVLTRFTTVTLEMMNKSEEFHAKIGYILIKIQMIFGDLTDEMIRTKIGGKFDDDDDDDSFVTLTKYDAINTAKTMVFKSIIWNLFSSQSKVVISRELIKNPTETVINFLSGNHKDVTKTIAKSRFSGITKSLHMDLLTMYRSSPFIVYELNCVYFRIIEEHVFDRMLGRHAPWKNTRNLSMVITFIQSTLIIYLFRMGDFESIGMLASLLWGFVELIGAYGKNITVNLISDVLDKMFGDRFKGAQFSMVFLIYSFLTGLQSLFMTLPITIETGASFVTKLFPFFEIESDVSKAWTIGKHIILFSPHILITVAPLLLKILPYVGKRLLRIPGWVGRKFSGLISRLRSRFDEFDTFSSVVRPEDPVKKPKPKPKPKLKVEPESELGKKKLVVLRELSWDDIQKEMDISEQEIPMEIHRQVIILRPTVAKPSFYMKTKLKVRKLLRITGMFFKAMYESDEGVEIDRKIGQMLKNYYCCTY